MKIHKSLLFVEYIPLFQPHEKLEPIREYTIADSQTGSPTYN